MSTNEQSCSTSSLITEIPVLHGMSTSAGLRRFRHRHHSSSTSSIEGFIQTKTECKWIALRKTPFQLVQVTFQLRRLSDTMVFRFLIGFISWTMIDAIDFIRPHLFVTSSSVSQGFDRLRHRASTVTHHLCLSSQSGIEVDEQSAHFICRPTASSQQIFIRSYTDHNEKKR